MIEEVKVSVDEVPQHVGGQYNCPRCWRYYPSMNDFYNLIKCIRHSYCYSCMRTELQIFTNAG